MSRDRLRFIWPTLCVFLACGLVVSTIHWRKELRAATTKRKKPAQPPTFDKRDAAFFRELAAMEGYQAKQPLTGADAARLAAYDRLELNKHWAIAQGREPTTFESREQTFAQRLTVPLAATMQFQIAEPLKHFRYELTNRSERAQRAPILFHQYRWDSAAQMVAQAGFKDIADEVERAVAVWRFVCARRVFGEPPTEGTEEHDIVKFFAIYGYGYCDDTARAMATLAELSGLQSRVWELDGHVVAEVMAAGKWRMMDADQQAYFHRSDAPLDILGVEELAANAEAFSNIVSLRKASGYPAKYRECFLDRKGDKVAGGGTAKHRIDAVLRGGEQIAFTNYNWGRYFLGKYPTPPPQFFNGTFTYALQTRDLVQQGTSITCEPVESGFRLTNTADHEATMELPFAYPFPIVGGSIVGQPTVLKGKAGFRLEESDSRRTLELDLREKLRVDLDRFVAVLTSIPTYRFAITFTLGPRAVVELRGFQVISDFQFARMALLPVATGMNEFHAHIPEGSKPEDFELAISWR